MHNHHCCALRVNRNGLLIEGRSRSGKTSLMLGLLERAGIGGIDSALVSDDQAFLTADELGLIASAPLSISGKVEITGFGIVDYPHEARCQITHVVRLTTDDKIDRMPEKKNTELLGITLPLVLVPERHEELAVRIVFAYLGLS